MYLDGIISKKDAVEMLETINGCLSCSNAGEAVALIDKVQGLVGFDHAVYGLAKLKTNGTIESYETMNFSYPTAWLDFYREKGFHRIDPVSIENFSTFRLQYWKDTYQRRGCPKEFISASRDFLLDDGYACGVKNHKGTEGSILSLAGPLEKIPRNDYIIETLTPHLHLAFSNTLQAEKKQHAHNLSKREIEVLNWLKQGKSSWDISKIFSISESTVKFHVNNIMAKLDAVSRTHAVAIALSEGLIDIH